MIILQANSARHPPTQQKVLKMSGKDLQELRKQHNITQYELSKQTKVSRSLISKFENGRKMSGSMQRLFELFFEKLSKGNS